MGRRWLLHTGFNVSDHWVHGEFLIVRKSEDVDIVNESGMVNRGAVVDRLVKSVLLLCHGGVVDVDESICGAREEDSVVAGMELEL